jgi:hypothetical protein
MLANFSARVGIPLMNCLFSNTFDVWSTMREGCRLFRSKHSMLA